MPKNSDLPLTCMICNLVNTDSERLSIGILFNARFCRVLETVVKFYEAEPALQRYS